MILLCGASGVTGSRIAQTLQARGVAQLLAARNRGALLTSAQQAGLEANLIRSLDLDDPVALNQALEGVDVIVNAAAPAHRHAVPLAAAAVKRGIAYTDISGDIASTWRLLRELDGPARDSGATLVPGAGFAPYGGLAALRLALERLPGATQAEWAYRSDGFKASAGTVLSEIEGLIGPCLELERGQLTDTGRFGAVRRDGDRWLLTRPMLDPLLASTVVGIKDCRVALVMPRGQALAVGWGSRGARALLKSRRLRDALQRRLSRAPRQARDAADDADTHNTVDLRLRRGPEMLQMRLRLPPVYPATAACCAAVAERLLRLRQRPAGVVAAPWLFDSAAEAMQATGIAEFD